MGGLSPAITVEKLSFAYEERPILDEISLEIPSGQFTVLLGKNGSGKSTLMRILGGMLEFERGEVRIMGEELRSFSTRGRAKVLGYLPQHHRPVFPFAVEDVVLTGRASYVSYAPRQEDLDIAVEALRRIGILHLRERPYTELSGGEQQMVRIARVLAQQPRLILLDEPTSHLDFLNQAHLLQADPRAGRRRPHCPRRPPRPEQRLPLRGPLHLPEGGQGRAAAGGRAAVGPRLPRAHLRHRDGLDPLRRPRPGCAAGVRGKRDSPGITRDPPRGPGQAPRFCPAADSSAAAARNREPRRKTRAAT